MSWQSTRARAHHEEDSGERGDARVTRGEREARVPENARHTLRRGALRVAHVRQAARTELQVALAPRAQPRSQLAHRQEVRPQTAG